jgi:hypothetical protein
MKITIITSCTGTKAIRLPLQLTQEDFQKGYGHVAERERSLGCEPVCAEAFYRGEQHLRLLRGVHAARERGIDVRVWIVSAGYGLVPGHRPLYPYDVTFNDMAPVVARWWAQEIGLPQQVQAALAEPAEYGLILLGDRYLDVCQLHAIERAPAATWALCGTASAKRLPKGIRALPLRQSDTSQFNAGNIGLKGEVAARMLEATDSRFEEAVARIAPRH